MLYIGVITGDILGMMETNLETIGVIVIIFATTSSARKWTPSLDPESVCHCCAPGLCQFFVSCGDFRALLQEAHPKPYITHYFVVSIFFSIIPVLPQ